MGDIKNVLRVAESNLCTGCGTCVSLCSRKAASLSIDDKKGIYIPVINENQCTNCGICLEVCPGHEFVFGQLNQEIFGKQPENLFVGNYIDCYTGYSTNHETRYNCSSGGLITQLLLYALENKIIDGALVTRMKRDDPLKPEPFIARTKEEIYEARGSKYCPVPANLMLDEILKTPEDEKFAVVGLPCHIQGIKKAEQINNVLKKKIVLHLGIFCNHTPTFSATELFFKKLKVRKEDIMRIEYRGQGWPGKMKISTKDGEVDVLLSDYWNFIGSSFFYPMRCLMCSDAFAELADISFGDAWLPEYKGDGMGISILIARTINGIDMINRVCANRMIQLTRVTADKVMLSNLQTAYRKKRSAGDRLNVLERISVFIPTNEILSDILTILPLKAISMWDAFLNRGIQINAKYIPDQHQKPYKLENQLKILIPNYDSSLNYGCGALLITLVEMLRNSSSDIEITVLTTHPKVSLPVSDIRVLPTIGTFYFSKNDIFPKKTRETLLYLFSAIFGGLFLKNKGGLKEYLDADVIISSGGDTLTEDNGIFSFISNANRFLFAWMLKKPFILQSESIGYFKHSWTEAYAKFILNRAKLIIVREDITYQYLKNILNIKSPLFITADLAFLLSASSDEIAAEILKFEGLKDEKMPLIGLNVSKKVSTLIPYQKYIKIFADLVDYLVCNMGATVILIPHVVEQGNDDRDVANDVYNIVKNKKDVLMIKRMYTPQETKAIIGKCDLFIGARMHSTIASTSMNVPTLCIAYSNKAHGIIGRMLGHDRYVINFNNIDYNVLVSTVNNMWNNRMKIQKELNTKIIEIKKCAMSNALLINEYAMKESR